MNEYHNPENVPESEIPKGWTLIPKDQFPFGNFNKLWDEREPCRAWMPEHNMFGTDAKYLGNDSDITYIIKQ